MEKSVGVNLSVKNTRFWQGQRALGRNDSIEPQEIGCIGDFLGTSVVKGREALRRHSERRDGRQIRQLQRPSRCYPRSHAVPIGSSTGTLVGG